MALNAQARETLDKWHRMVAAADLSAVASLCAPEAVFRSPVAHTPYRGAELVAAFSAAGRTGVQRFPLPPQLCGRRARCRAGVQRQGRRHGAEGHRHDPFRRDGPHRRLRGDGAARKRTAGARRRDGTAHDACSGGQTGMIRPGRCRQGAAMLAPVELPPFCTPPFCTPLSIATEQLENRTQDHDGIDQSANPARRNTDRQARA